MWRGHDRAAAGAAPQRARRVSDDDAAVAVNRVGRRPTDSKDLSPYLAHPHAGHAQPSRPGLPILPERCAGPVTSSARRRR